MDSRSHKTSSISTGHNSHDLHQCHRCGWPFPNPHPSAKHRRAHKRVCGTIEGYKVIISEEQNNHLTVSDEEHISDDNREHTPSPKSNKKIGYAVGSSGGVGEKSNSTEDDVFADADMEFGDSGNTFRLQEQVEILRPEEKQVESDVYESLPEKTGESDVCADKTEPLKNPANREEISRPEASVNAMVLSENVASTEATSDGIVTGLLPDVVESETPREAVDDISETVGVEPPQSEKNSQQDIGIKGEDKLTDAATEETKESCDKLVSESEVVKHNSVPETENQINNIAGDIGTVEEVCKTPVGESLSCDEKVELEPYGFVSSSDKKVEVEANLVTEKCVVDSKEVEAITVSEMPSEKSTDVRSSGEPETHIHVRNNGGTDNEQPILKDSTASLTDSELTSENKNSRIDENVRTENPDSSNASLDNTFLDIGDGRDTSEDASALKAAGIVLVAEHTSDGNIVKSNGVEHATSTKSLQDEGDAVKPTELKHGVAAALNRFGSSSSICDSLEGNCGSIAETIFEAADKTTASQVEASRNNQHLKSDAPQACSFPTNESENKNKLNEAIAKVTNWDAEKQHSPLKDLLDDVKPPSTITKHDPTKNEVETKSNGANPEAPLVKGSDVNNKDIDEWNSPARYPTTDKTETKKKKGSKGYWLPFVCCSSVHREF